MTGKKTHRKYPEYKPGTVLQDDAGSFIWTGKIKDNECMDTDYKLSYKVIPIGYGGLYCKWIPQYNRWADEDYVVKVVDEYVLLLEDLL